MQTATIPVVLRGQDVWAQAATGSGKTAAFALPILQERLEARAGTRGIAVLVLVPTRELAAQVGGEFRLLASGLPGSLKIVTVYGGVSVNPHMMALRGGADVLIATPGRLIDLVERNAARLGGVGTLVLDEADRLLDLGFAEELGQILQRLPAKRQTLLFSATFPPAVEKLARDVLHGPARVTVAVDPAQTPLITERAIELDQARRTAVLRQLLAQEGWSRVLVFVATKHSSEHVAEKLRRLGVEATSLHGELSQGARTNALLDLKAGRVQVVVATDLAARGLDIRGLPAVVNYDLPRSTEDYTHRIGRTGRAGEPGVAVTFVTAATYAHFRLIEKRQGRQIPREQLPGFEPEEREAPAIAPTGGVKGRRKSKKDKLREAAAKDSSRLDGRPGEHSPS